VPTKSESTTPSAGSVLTELEDSVLVVTINRPEAMNAIDSGVSAGIGEALERAEADPGIRAVVLTGAGDRAFCAGADLKAVARGEDLSAPGHRDWGFAGWVRHQISKPTIAAINGFALGGGTEIALASDLAVALDRAQLGLPEVKRGIYAGAGGVIRLPRQLPRKIAFELIMTGDMLSAPEALRFGLLNRVVQEDVLGAALDLARKVAVNAPLAVQACKRIALHALDESEDNAWEFSLREGAALMKSQDAREGLLAFAEKREPIWTGT
jgi:crotonobetainyl-CoA hydratase